MDIIQLSTDDAIAEADSRRGHTFLPTAAVMATVPPLRRDDNGKVDNGSRSSTMIYLHYYVRDHDWWLSAVDMLTMKAWGFAHLGNPLEASWREVELAELAVQTMGEGEAAVYVQRDQDWEPEHFGFIALASSILATQQDMQDRGDTSW